ncbi:hypothetical protein SK128_001518 [Halocaridina rubra]|uniref:Uncharacterized protein n=1 Tax=Halocaridina rubra TaxID=373956 RepID=A0AAN9FUY4_HALRR
MFVRFVPVLRHGLPFLPRVKTFAFLRRPCFGRCNRYPECMPLLTSDRDGARTLDLAPQSCGHYRLSHGKGGTRQRSVHRCGAQNINCYRPRKDAVFHEATLMDRRTGRCEKLNIRIKNFTYQYT